MASLYIWASVGVKSPRVDVEAKTLPYSLRVDNFTPQILHKRELPRLQWAMMWAAGGNVDALQ